MNEVKVVSVSESPLKDEYCYKYGKTLVDVTLTDGIFEVTCEGILIWEEDDLEATFEDWLNCARVGEEGFNVRELA